MKLLFRVPKSITFLLGMTILIGVLYPAALTLAAQLIFPNKANGSLLVIKGAVRGSRLLAQKFESPRFFRARPSASDYTYVGSGASNLGPVSADLAKAVADRRDAWAKTFGTRTPEGMLYASASGLDPDIGLEAAVAQADRVAGARSLSPAAKAALVDAIDKAVERSTTLIGPPRVNVVSLNAQLETDPVFRDAREGG
jgi:K+-transporting ATPase ATPase C chain